MSRLENTFNNLRSQNRKGLIPFITAGYPFINITSNLLLAMADAGADVIELGMPFSDPMADGPTIQEASEKAINDGVNIEKTLNYVAEFRKKNQKTPIILMGYANPIVRFDQLNSKNFFLDKAKNVGVDGLLIVDYPLEECEDFAKEAKSRELDLIFLLAPTSTSERIKQVVKTASGYIYYVSLKGITGAKTLNLEEIKIKVSEIKGFTNLPVAVGFGIRDNGTAKEISKMSDAIIIGSSLIEIAKNQPYEKVIPLISDFLQGVRNTIDKTTE